MRIGALLKAAGLAPSTSEAMRKLGERAVRVDGDVVEARDLLLKPGGEHLLQLGKRGFARVRLVAGG
jgi:tyrosyl-tRNA synthetase